MRRKIDLERRLTEEFPVNQYICPGRFCMDRQFAVCRLKLYILYFLGFIRFHPQTVLPQIL